MVDAQDIMTFIVSKWRNSSSDFEVGSFPPSDFFTSPITDVISIILVPSSNQKKKKNQKFCQKKEEERSLWRLIFPSSFFSLHLKMHPKWIFLVQSRNPPQSEI